MRTVYDTTCRSGGKREDRWSTHKFANRTALIVDGVVRTVAV